MASTYEDILAVDRTNGASLQDAQNPAGLTSNKLGAMLELERRGKLPPEYQPALDEARSAARPLIDPAASSNGQQLSGEPIIVEVPGVGEFEFPNGTSDATIEHVLAKYLRDYPSHPRAAAAMAARAGTLQVSPESTYRAKQFNDENMGPLYDATHMGRMEALGRGVTQGLTFGFGDEMVAALRPYLHEGETYDSALANERKLLEQARADRPGYAMGGEVAGAVAAPGGAGATFINKGSTTIARMLRGGLTGGVAGGIYGFGDGEGGAGNRVQNSAVSAAIGTVGGGILTGVGQGFTRAHQALSKRPELQEAMPTLDGMRDLSKSLYAKARDLGGVLPDSEMRSMVANAKSMLHGEGFDAQLHPRLAAAVRRLERQSGDVSLADMEILRRVAGNAAQSLQPDEQRLASKLIDQIDDAVDGMGDGSAVLRDARDVWSRLRRMETIEGAIERASLQDDFAAGLRNQFKSLLRNPKALRSFSEAERAGIKAVATGTSSVKALRGLSYILSPAHLPGVALTGGAFATGAGMSALAIPATSYALKASADALTRRGARNASALAGRSDAQRAIFEALMSAPNPLARGAVATSPVVDALMGSQR